MAAEQSFPFYLRRSFYIHCALSLCTLIGGKVMLKHQEELRNNNIQLVHASVRVDMVAMPKYTQEELKVMAEDKPAMEKVEAKKEEKKEEKPAEEVKAKPNEDFKTKMAKEVEEAQKHQSFLTSLKQLSDKKINDKKNKAKGNETQTLKSPVYAGNKLAQGSAVTGDRNSEDLGANQLYASKVAAKVRPNWRLPNFLKEKKLNCIVRVRIARNGDVIQSEILKSSKDEEYDKKALEAVNNSSPFPALSKEIKTQNDEVEIGLGFPLTN